MFSRKSPSYIWETSYPVLAGGITFVLIIIYGAQLFGKMEAGKVELSNLYTAIAGLFAIITGFLATFYGSIQAIVDTRLKRIARTNVFQRFIGYIKIATLAGFVIAIASIPYIILAPSAGGSFGGTGKPFPWKFAPEFVRHHPRITVILAGGLNPENVAEAVSVVRPRGVDVTTGVEESPGRKDHSLIRAFVQAARNRLA